MSEERKNFRGLRVDGEVTLQFTRDNGMLHVSSPDVTEFYISGARVSDVFDDIGPVLKIILQQNYGHAWASPEKKETPDV